MLWNALMGTYALSVTRGVASQIDNEYYVNRLVADSMEL